tara:strand:- start:1209 stop:1640 length:432 start_codon:yes stop_codon:yes gene_type:complete
MPKPILSDSLFNADDVATAILNKANLQIANNNLAVTDISSSFTLNSSIFTEQQGLQAYHFNGFVFINSRFKADSTPSAGTKIYDIASDYTPNGIYSTPAVGIDSDTVGQIQFRDSDSTIKMWDPVNAGDSIFFLCFSGFYRIS